MAGTFANIYFHIRVRGCNAPCTMSADLDNNKLRPNNSINTYPSSKSKETKEMLTRSSQVVETDSKNIISES